MRPLRLTMQAFGSYGAPVSIDFTKTVQNLFLITGDTGAGKSTIFDGIVFALYGETGSSSNKKEGVVLQSQYAAMDAQPFAELTFSENGQIYTVRRVPRYRKTVTRGAQKGSWREISGSVTLTMPDGTEYPPKETDGKLEELIGLTKGQFMQVAMIAQGEFMDLLRAKSDDKKVIFRKLFHTELYQEIAEELNRRRKEKEKNLAVIQTQCGAEAARLQIPAQYPQADVMQEQKDRFAGGDRSAAPDLLEMLGELCAYLEENTQKTEQTYREADRLRDARKTEYTNAENLLGLFEQLDQAQAELAACEEQKESAKAAQELSARLKAAYEMAAVYQRFADAKQETENIQKELARQQEELPRLVNAAAEAETASAAAKEEQEKELEQFSKTDERVKKAEALFAKIEEAKKEAAQKMDAQQQAEKQGKALQKKLEELREQETAGKEQLQKLEGAQHRLELWQIKERETRDLADECREFAKQGEKLEEHRKNAQASKDSYLRAREAYAAQAAEYESMRQAFLDGQAGILARELVPGSPCPVCGSTEHPHPHARELGQDISKEMLDALQKKTDALRGKQEDLAAQARSDMDLLTEREKTFAQTSARLLEKFADIGFSGLSAQNFTPQAAEQWMSQRESAVKDEGEKLRQDAKRCLELQKQCKESEEAIARLQEETEGAKTREAEAAAAYRGAAERLKSLEETKDYPTPEDARREHEAAKQALALKNEASRKAGEQAAQTQRAKERAEALAQRYAAELPGRERRSEECRAQYETALQEYGFAQEHWQSLTEQYQKAKVEELQEKVQKYQRARAAAEAREAAAKEQIKGRERPMLQEIRRRVQEAEEARTAAEAAYEKFREAYRTDLAVYRELAPKMEARQKEVQEHARLDVLYRLVSGNVSGSRMDLETYVQRYYLERILSAANRRFYTMTAGQFELRMVDLEQAGEGKNRGLDLMVYSTVTGKERQIRTLSGGESFMAALSLALGMSDQIREHSAGVNLDMMFIDEGFGSLDEHSRSQAVKVLQGMAEGSRLIGIISHVTELKQEIEDQLLVTRDETGSHVRWRNT